jgi:sulfonate transport system permease protein
VVGLGRWGMVRQVVIPGALPSILVGLRYSLGIAVIALVVAEQINATQGIGAMMSEAREFLRTDVIVVGLVVYSLLGLAADVVVRLLERRLLSWRRAFRGA